MELNATVKRDWQQGQGFSLVELVVVLAIVTITGATVATFYAPVRDQLSLGLSARQLVIDLSSARYRAISSNATHRLLFSEGSGRYVLQRRKGDSYVDTADPVELPGGIRIASCSAVGDAISFRSRGNAGTFGTVTLVNAAGRQRRVIVNIAGRVRLG